LVGDTLFAKIYKEIMMIVMMMMTKIR